jgi:hypothetical protein
VIVVLRSAGAHWVIPRRSLAAEFAACRSTDHLAQDPMSRPERADLFVGRSAPLAEFADAVQSAGRRLPSVLLVSGDAGIGKSRLVAEAARVAGFELFRARCPPHGGDAIPLGALADLLRQVRRRVPTDAIESLTPLLEWLSPTHGQPGRIDTGTLFSSVLDLLDATRSLGTSAR